MTFKARLQSVAGARQRLSVTGACHVSASNTFDMVRQMALASAKSRKPLLTARIDPA